MTSQISSLTAGNVNLLAVDTSSIRGSVALAIGSQNVKQFEWDKKSTHSEIATKETKRLLDSCQIQFKDLTHLSINVGPGSFTGIRVGLNLVRALAYTLDLPIATFNTLQLLAFKNGSAGENLLVATKAVQNFFYVAGYRVLDSGLEMTLDSTSMTLEDIEKIRSSYTKVLIEGHTPGLETYTDAGLQIAMVRKWPEVINFFNWKNAKPLYVRASEAEEKMRRGLLKPL